jgi:thioredoxin 1
MKKKFSEIINSKTPVLVDFYADWCGPCKTMKPILEDLKNELGDETVIIKIDVDKNSAIANSYQIRSIPTIILFQNGKVKWRQSGVVSATTLKNVIENNTEK